VARRALPALLLAAAALADTLGAHPLALYALLAAIPVVSVIALATLGEVLDGPAPPGRQLQGLLWALVLVLLVAGAGSRAPAVREDAVPALGVSALVAALVVLACEAVAALVSDRERVRGVAG
jgi:hypothetical protein